MNNGNVKADGGRTHYLEHLRWDYKKPPTSGGSLKLALHHGSHRTEGRDTRTSAIKGGEGDGQKPRPTVPTTQAAESCSCHPQGHSSRMLFNFSHVWEQLTGSPRPMAVFFQRLIGGRVVWTGFWSSSGPGTPGRGIHVNRFVTMTGCIALFWSNPHEPGSPLASPEGQWRSWQESSQG